MTKHGWCYEMLWSNYGFHTSYGCWTGLVTLFAPWLILDTPQKMCWTKHYMCSTISSQTYMSSASIELGKWHRNPWAKNTNKTTRLPIKTIASVYLPNCSRFTLVVWCCLCFCCSGSFGRWNLSRRLQLLFIDIRCLGPHGTPQEAPEAVQDLSWRIPLLSDWDRYWTILAAAIPSLQGHATEQTVSCFHLLRGSSGCDLCWKREARNQIWTGSFRHVQTACAEIYTEIPWDT